MSRFPKPSIIPSRDIPTETERQRNRYRTWLALAAILIVFAALCRVCT
jgi:hypothetical protein